MRFKLLSNVTPRQHVENLLCYFHRFTFHTAIIREFGLIVAEFDVYRGVMLQIVLSYSLPFHVKRDCAPTRDIIN